MSAVFVTREQREDAGIQIAAMSNREADPRIRLFFRCPFVETKRIYQKTNFRLIGVYGKAEKTVPSITEWRDDRRVESEIGTRAGLYPAVLRHDR